MGQDYTSFSVYDWNGTYDGGQDVGVPPPGTVVSIGLPTHAAIQHVALERARWVPVAEKYSLSKIGGEQGREVRYDDTLNYDGDYAYDGHSSALAIPHSSDIRVDWKKLAEDHSEKRLRFSEAARFESIKRLRWNGTTPHNNTTYVTLRDAIARLAESIRMPWAGTQERDASYAILWAAAAAKLVENRFSWSGSLAREGIVRIRWRPGAPFTSGYTIPLPGDPDLPPGSTIEIPSLAVYYMTPALSIIRTSDGADLKAIDCSIKLDLQSYAWTLDATIPRQTLPLVDPNVNDDPVLVQVSINGYVGNFIIESYSDNRKFGGTGAKITGRTRSALLGAPYAPLDTFTNTETKDASQLATDLVPIGWTLTWNAPDWLVPAGIFSYADQSPIQAIAQLANAIGATILPDMADQILTVQPIYQTSPWNWDTATPYADIPAAFWTDLSGQWEGQFKTAYNGIYVSGQNSGVIGLVKRTGTDGGILLPSVSDALIVHVDAARERGRIELAKADKRKTETIKVPLLPAPAGVTNPGIFLPGQLIQVTEKNEARTSNVTWKALVLSNTIDAAHGSSAGSSMSVRQTLSVERHG